MSIYNFILNWVEYEKDFITWGPSFEIYNKYKQQYNVARHVNCNV